MIKSLRRKFVAITMLLVSLVLLGVFFGIGLYNANNLRQRSMRSLEMALARPYGGGGPSFELGAGMPNDLFREPVFVVQVDAAGTPRLVSAERISVDEDTLAQLTAVVLDKGEMTGVLPSYDLRYLVEQRQGSTRIAFITRTFEKEQVRSVMLGSGLAVAGALVVFFLASMLLARWALKPVEQAWQHQRRFVADASHELKTPITVILANLGILKNSPKETIERQMDWIDNSEAEARRMKGLVEDLLFLAKADDATVAAPMAPMNLSDCITTAVLGFEPVAFEQGIAIDMEVEMGLQVTGTLPQLRQLADVLLDNAVKYSHAGSTVKVGLHRRQGAVELAVSNRGAFITPEEGEHLFERFYRADAARPEGGYGLGLSIAKAIVEKHKGKIAVKSDPGETVFIVSLPV
ncbi:MAG: sensor histidine kinase [Oscillospiraceae bacterium]